MPETSEDKTGGPTHDPFNIQQFARLENARSFFQNYLTPGFVAAAHWETLELVRARYIDGELRSHYPDLLFKVQLEHQLAFIYLLFEHKSYLDPLTPWQLLRQTVHLWHDWLTEPENASATHLPLILPLVLYHGERDWNLSRNFADLIDVPPALKAELTPHLPDFEHLLVDLHALPMNQIRGSLEVRAILALQTRTPKFEGLRWCKILSGKGLRRSEAYSSNTSSFDESLCRQKIAADRAFQFRSSG